MGGQVILHTDGRSEHSQGLDNRISFLAIVYVHVTIILTLDASCYTINREIRRMGSFLA
jgi:hypothetical protein